MLSFAILSVLLRECSLLCDGATKVTWEKEKKQLLVVPCKDLHSLAMIVKKTGFWVEGNTFFFVLFCFWNERLSTYGSNTRLTDSIFI